MTTIETKDFYEKIDRVESRIIARIDQVNEKISIMSREIGEINTEVRNNSGKIKMTCSDVEELKDKDRGVLAMASAIGGAIGAASAAALKFLGAGE